MTTPRLFLLFGVLCLLTGMSWGIHMSIQQNFSLAPAHAHLNLIGFVLSTLFGLYYAVTPAAGGSGLARLHLGIHAAAVVIMVPGIVTAIREQGEIAAIVGSLLAVLSALTFLVQLLRYAPGRG
ncbi:MAG: hypothetical protein KDK12_08195 [Rhodobacteraceae bacterium]|nr:hypothetical protein [Paracoccaceae bacterium]